MSEITELTFNVKESSEISVGEPSDSDYVFSSLSGFRTAIYSISKELAKDGSSKAVLRSVGAIAELPFASMNIYFSKEEEGLLKASVTGIAADGTSILAGLYIGGKIGNLPGAIVGVLVSVGLSLILNPSADYSYDYYTDKIQQVFYDDNNRTITYQTSIEDLEAIKDLVVPVLECSIDEGYDEYLEGVTIHQLVDGTENIYEVETGDTIWGLCQKYNITYDEMIELNPWLSERFSEDMSFALIRPGEELLLPGGKCEMCQNIEDSFTEAEEARVVQYQDPLLIDLDGDGIETTTIENGVYFDHGNDGFEELSAWVGSDDGILVYDKNNNGVIDNGNELFSDNYTKLDGTQAVSGFDALGDFDSNSDGVINSSDTNFDTIKVLKGDGTVMSLSDAGVSSITLSHTNKNVEDANGNVQKTEGTYTRADGSTSKLGDYLFANDSITTIAKDWLEVPETITELPDIAGMGNVYSLHQAMVRDEELKTLVEGFATTSTPRARQLLVEQIIYKWSGVEDVSTDSRGSSVDGRKLEALEEFVGREFVGMSSSGTQTATNPGVNAGKILTNTFTKLVDYVYAELEAQTVLKPVFEQLEFSYDETLDKYVYDLSTVKSTIDETILTNAVTGKELLLDFAKVFVNLGLEDVSNYADFKSYFVAKGEEYELLFKTIDSINLYGTGDGEDIDGSPESETIFGYEGNDNILARQGDDLVYGGSGDDVIDTCYGNDVIFGEEGNDTIKSGNDDDVIYGGSGDDVIWSGSGNDTVYGGAGNDSLTNQGGNDYVDLGVGDDSYTSNTVTRSNDTIICGAGNDTYYDSDAGNDTYIFNLGDGNDIISDNNGNDEIVFGEGISLANTKFYGVGVDLMVSFQNGSDTIKVNNFLNNGTGVVEGFEFSDGSVLSTDDVFSRLVLEGTEGNDRLTGTKVSETIYGYGGDDVINSGKGDDKVYAGAGNDTLSNLGGNDYIDMGAGNDSYVSNTITRANDTVIGGEGNDSIRDSDAGNDTYIFNLGDGEDVLYDNNGEDVIRFGSSVDIFNVGLYKDNLGDIYIDYGTTSGSDVLQVRSQNSGTSVVERYEFEQSEGEVVELTNAEINVILQDMNAYAQEQEILISSVTDVKNNPDLMNIIATGIAAA